MRLANVLGIHSIASMATASSVGFEQERRSNAFQGEIVAAHNFFRRQHGVGALTWNGGLARKAQSWASTCNWSHDSAGENLASSTGVTSWGAFVNMWGAERKDYNWNRPGFSLLTGHFTQVVWKNTRSVGCGWQQCSGGQGKARGIYVVCKYDPIGNYEGQFSRNVGKQISGWPTEVWH